MKQFYFFAFLFFMGIVFGQNQKPESPFGVKQPIVYTKIPAPVVKVTPTIISDNSVTKNLTTTGGTRSVIDLTKGIVIDQVDKGNPIKDNTIAVSTNFTTCSNQQTVVSAKNSRISYYKIDGTPLGSTEIDSFVNLPNPNPLYEYVDPKLLFDSDYNRYIFSFFEQNTAFTETTFYIYVSETCDPLGSWYGLIVKDSLFLPGTQVFDRPVIGMSQREVYISFNTSDDGQFGTFRGSRLFAIEKDSFYYQKTVFLRDVQIPGIDQIYGLHPVSYGDIGNYGPGIYLVHAKTTTHLVGFDSVYMYNVTADIFTDTAKYLRFAYKTSEYKEPYDLSQKNSASLLNVRTTRVYDAFYLNGVIHFVYHKQGSANPNLAEISYNRIDAATNQLTEIVYGNLAYGCAYPSITSFTNDPLNKSALIGFLTSGPNTYPAFHAVACDDSLNWGNDLSIIEGDTIYEGGQWGDYTGGFKNHASTNEPICWLAGQHPTWEITYLDTTLIIGTDTFHIMDTSIVLNNRAYLAEIKKNPFGNAIYNAINVIPVTIYPNPAENYFQISFPKNINNQYIQLKMYDTKGNLISNYYKGLLHNMPDVFNLQNIPQGLYIIELSNQNNQPLGYEKLLVY